LAKKFLYNDVVGIKPEDNILCLVLLCHLK